MIEGKCYEFESSPELSNPGEVGAKPEAIYRDAQSGEMLVIERKQFMFPEDYGHSHSIDHEFFNRLLASVPPSVANGPYVLNCPTPIVLDRDKLESLVIELALEIEKAMFHWGDCEGSMVLMVEGRAYTLRDKSPDEVDEMNDEIFSQLRIAYGGPRIYGPDPVEFEKFLRDKWVPKITTALTKKFSGFGNARRALILNQIGPCVRLQPSEWRRILRKVIGLLPCDEIWALTFVEEGYEAEDGSETGPMWEFQKLWPCRDDVTNVAEGFAVQHQCYCTS